jgi:hypothetical protein
MAIRNRDMPSLPPDTTRDNSRRRRRSRDTRTASPDTAPAPKRAPDAAKARAAVEDARSRARALALLRSPDTATAPPTADTLDTVQSSGSDVANVTDGEMIDIERLSPEKRSIFNRLRESSILDKDPKSAAIVAGASIGVATAFATGLGSAKLSAIGAGAVYLGWKSLPVVDWLARKLDKLGTSMIDNNIPILKYLTKPLGSILDASAKLLGVDKSLFEHLRKNKEDKKKLAEKLHKEFLANEKKYFAKLDAAGKKQKRQTVLENKFGKEVADILGSELDDAAKNDTAPPQAPAAPMAAAA